MRSFRDDVLALLPRVSKPSRYLEPIHGGRANDLVAADVSWALLFPDTAESGYPHHGLEILYHILNETPGLAAERAFFPWTDMEREMRAAGVPLFSSETYRPVGELDILGITLQYELSYTNVLAAIDLAGLPLRSEERAAPLPLVVGGGPCAMNPEPLAPFFDLFLVGEGEEGVLSISGAVRQWKREGGRSKEDLLDRLARLEGVYVPALRDERPGADGSLLGPPRKKVRRLALKRLSDSPMITSPLVPAGEAIHDRVYAEIARGCAVGCRFCQAGMIYRPLRERPAAEVVEGAFRASQNTGHEDISLASLSIGDHGGILPMMRALNRALEGRQVGISLPSLRASTLSEEMVAEVARFRKTGFTIAPEAGSERMLRLINKEIQREDVIDAAERAVREGWDLLKLYFLIGLPTEEDEDLDGIASLCEEVWRIGRREAKRSFRLNVSVSSLVPKPHTPFQWERQCGREEIERKQRRIRERLPRSRAVALKCHNPEQTEIEGVLSRGDRRLAGVLEWLVRHGARFDEWSETFSFDLWRRAFEEAGVDPAAYLRERDEHELLPWDRIDVGIEKEFLLRERRRAREGMETPSCRVECRVCGVCGEALFVDKEETADEEPAAPPPAPPPEAEHRLRFRFTKSGVWRFLSHLELMRLFRLALRRSGLPLAYSRGFHPHLRISFGPALPVGHAGEEEPVDIFFAAAVAPDVVEGLLNRELPEGVRVISGEEIPMRAPALDALSWEMEYDVRLPAGADRAGIEERVRGFLAAGEVWGEKKTKGKVRSVDLRRGIVDARFSDDGALALRVVSGARVADVLRLFAGEEDEGAYSFAVRRLTMRPLPPKSEEKRIESPRPIG